MTSREVLRGPTPGGGDYSEAYYFDDSWQAVDKKDATKVMIRELLDDGTLVRETRMNKRK